MGDAVIVSTARTAIGTAYKGTLIDVDAIELGTKAVAEAVRRAGIDPALIDDVVLGESLYGGGDIARLAAIGAGIQGVAGGAQSTSLMPMSTRRVPGTDDVADWMSPSHPDSPTAPAFDMSITVGWNAAVEANVTREQMDAWALRSHERAIAAIDEGRFDEEIFPLEVPRRDDTTTTFAIDEHPRRGSTMEKMASLKPIHPEIEGFSITAGNSSGLNDAAAAMVLADRALAEANGLEALAAIRGWASVGVAPERTGLAPTEAIPKALERTGLAVGDIDLWEINEAFASMCVATTRILGIDEEIVNVSGSGCSLGHPIAASGARMIITLVHELRRRGGGAGVAAMCAGGGMSTAVVLDVPAP